MSELLTKPSIQLSQQTSPRTLQDTVAVFLLFCNQNLKKVDILHIKKKKKTSSSLQLIPVPTIHKRVNKKQQCFILTLSLK
jgi:hypothetical protein